MRLFGRRGDSSARGGPARGGPGRAERREEVEEARRHLEDFVRTRVGVEAYIEPPTTFIPPTVLLIASSGEWTRRRVGDPGLVQGLAERLRVPVYNVQLTGYPQRMRDWNARVKREAKAAAAEAAARREDVPPWGTPPPPA